MDTINYNSSYVLIMIILSVRLRSDEGTSPGCPGKYTILIQDLFYMRRTVDLHVSNAYTIFNKTAGR